MSYEGQRYLICLAVKTDDTNPNQSAISQYLQIATTYWRVTWARCKLTVLYALFSLIFSTVLWDKHHYYWSFAHKESRPWQIKLLPLISQFVFLNNMRSQCSTFLSVRFSWVAKLYLFHYQEKIKTKLIFSLSWWHIK